MAILAYGVNYRTAPIDVRERLAFSEETLPAALKDAARSVSGAAEVAIISTCNRTELILSLDSPDDAAVANWLTNRRPVAMSELENAAYRYWDQDAADHLIRVAAGLDSQVLGEPQIMGQVKRSYELARAAGTMGSELKLLADITLGSAKRIRSDTDVGRNPVSVAYATVTMAQQIFTDLHRNKALLVGAGDTIRRVAEHLTKLGIAGLAIANRTLSHAEVLAADFHAEALQLTDVAARLADFDMLITSTGSALPIIGKGAVEAAIRRRCHKPMYIVDIAVPRDVEPQVSELPDVYLYTIDDLQGIIEENARQRRAAAQSAEHLVTNGTNRYLCERRALHKRNLLRSFRANAETIQQAELEKALRALGKGTDPQFVVEALSRSLTNKLIHAPTVAIRETSASNCSHHLDYLKALYALD